MKAKSVILSVISFVFFAIILFCNSAAIAQDYDVAIEECSGYYEQFLQCERTLPNGEKQYGSGVCKCQGRQLSGGCRLWATTYTESKFSKTCATPLSRTCSVKTEIRMCNSLQSEVSYDSGPECGEWSQCPEDGGDIADTCAEGKLEYQASPKDDCSTQTRTCCKGSSKILNRWSDWDEVCPLAECIEKNPCTSDFDCCNGKKCDGLAGAKTCGGVSIAPPSECKVTEPMPTCNAIDGATCSYTCRCENNKWVDCQKREFCNAGRKSVTNADGSLCCEMENCGKSNINGLLYNCMCKEQDIGITSRWVRLGEIYQEATTCPAGTPSEGAGCPENWIGNYCVAHHSYNNINGRGEEISTEYQCQRR